MCVSQRTKMPRDPVDKLAIEIRTKRFSLTIEETKKFTF